MKLIVNHINLYKLIALLKKAIKEADLEGEIILTLKLGFFYKLLIPVIQKVIDRILSKIGLDIKIRIK